MIKVNPAKTPANTTARPYARPISRADCAPLFPAAAAVVAAVPPKPVKAPAAFVACPAAPVVVDAIVVIVEVLTLMGFWAPHGLLARQLNWQVESPLQFLTQLEPYSVQMKYGMV